MHMTKKTHVYDWHAKHARMIEFAGYHMPVWYTSIKDEHMTVRKAVGIFDVSHMVRVLVSGKDATNFLDYIFATNVKKIPIGKAAYTVMCNERGGIVDDLIVYHRGDNDFFVVVNASNHEKDLNWMRKNSKGFDVKIDDVTDDVPMFAIQGPKAKDVVAELLNVNVDEVPRFGILEGKVGEYNYIAGRTGYTGEDGFEISFFKIPIDKGGEAIKIWEQILKIGEKYGIKPCGLGARDSLRLEAGLILYGNDANEDITPLEARIKFATDLSKEKFIGKEALLEKQKNITKKRVCFIMKEKAIPRPHFEILDLDNNVIGEVTSGTHSPLINNGIGMGYVKTEFSKGGTEVYINIRGRPRKAVIVLPHKFLKTLKEMSSEV